MLRFRPDIKPPMWGPPDAVRYAIRANCERVGMPSEFAGYWPAWGFGKVALADVMGLNDLTVQGVDNISAAAEGVKTHPGASTTATALVNNNVATGLTKTSGTMFITARLDTIDSNNILMSARSGTSGNRYFIREDSGTVNYGWTDTAVRSTSITFSTGFISLCLTWDTVGCRYYCNGSRIANTDIAATNNPTNFCLSNLSSNLAYLQNVNQTIAQAFVLKKPLSDGVACEITAEPYTLLMPVARPVYFDLGASAGTDNLTASDLVTGSPVLGTPALGQAHALTATGITTSAPVLGSPALGQVHELTVTALIVGAPVLGTPSLSENAADVDALTAVDLVVGSPVFGTPSLGQIHVLGSDGIVTGAPVLGSPSITQIHTLEALGLTVGVLVLGAPALNGSDIVLITAAEVARIVRATARMRTVKYEISRA